MKQYTCVSHSAGQTERLGRLLGSLLSAGSFIALQGELGGGKTCFTRGVVSAAAPQSAHLVASPTFAIMNEYPAATPVHHFDFYRLTNGHEIIELGFEDYFHGNGICIAEWAERLGELIPRDHLVVRFEVSGDDQRRIVMESQGSRSHHLLEQFEELLSAQKSL